MLNRDLNENVNASSADTVRVKSLSDSRAKDCLEEAVAGFCQQNLFGHKLIYDLDNLQRLDVMSNFGHSKGVNLAVRRCQFLWTRLLLRESRLFKPIEFSLASQSDIS